MDACHTQEQEKYRSSMFYVGIFQLFFTFVSYNYNLMAKFEIFSRNYHKRFWIVLKWCHTAKPGLEYIGTIFACIALHSIVKRNKKSESFWSNMTLWQYSIREQNWRQSLSAIPSKLLGSSFHARQTQLSVHKGPQFLIVGDGSKSYRWLL